MREHALIAQHFGMTRADILSLGMHEYRAFKDVFMEQNKEG